MIESLVNQSIPSDKLRMELFKKVAKEVDLEESEVEKIISFQFADIRAASNEFAVIEISNFCKFVINQAKIKRYEATYLLGVEKLKKKLETVPEDKKYKVQMDLNLYNDHIAYMRTKFREELPKTKHKQNNEKRKLAVQEKAVVSEVETEINEVF